MNSPRSIRRLLALAVLASAFGAPASAAPPTQPGWDDRHTHGNVHGLVPSLEVRGPGSGGHGHLKHHGGAEHVPELDPGAAGSAALLLGGGALLLLERRRRERA